LPYFILLFSSFLLVSDCFLATLTCAGIILCALAAHGQADTVTYATVATYVHEALDVELNLSAEVTLYLEIALYNLTNSCCLLVCPVFNFDVAVNSRALKNCVGCATADTVDVGQRNLSSLILRQIYADNSYCHIAWLQIFCKGNKFCFLVQTSGLYLFLFKASQALVAGESSLSLTLFKLWILFVDYVQSAFATNDLAVGRTFFD
jgi:hypothetical protein